MFNAPLSVSTRTDVVQHVSGSNHFFSFVESFSNLKKCIPWARLHLTPEKRWNIIKNWVLAMYFSFVGHHYKELRGIASISQEQKKKIKLWRIVTNWWRHQRKLTWILCLAMSVQITSSFCTQTQSELSRINHCYSHWHLTRCFVQNNAPKHTQIPINKAF